MEYLGFFRMKSRSHYSIRETTVFLNDSICSNLIDISLYEKIYRVVESTIERYILNKLTERSSEPVAM